MYASDDSVDSTAEVINADTLKGRQASEYALVEVTDDLQEQLDAISKPIYQFYLCDPSDSDIDNKLTEIYNSSEVGVPLYFIAAIGYSTVGGFYASLLYGTWHFCLNRNVLGEYGDVDSEGAVLVGIHSQGYSVIRRYNSTTGWAVWMWNNPPLVETLDYDNYAWGYSRTEFATTEMYNGRIVYTRLIDCGVVGVGNKYLGLDFYYSDSDNCHFIRCEGYYYDANGNFDCFPNENIKVTTTTGGMYDPVVCINSNYDYSNYKVFVRVWYTKDD